MLQAKPGRSVEQQQEYNSPNLGFAFWSSSAHRCVYLKGHSLSFMFSPKHLKKVHISYHINLSLSFQALASKMTEELEYLKHSGGANAAGSSATAEKNWKNRRSQKLEKMELLNLQSNLQSEIHAKQEITEELSRVRSELESSKM